MLGALHALYVLKVQSPPVCQDGDPSTWFSFPVSAPACERTFFVWPKNYSPCSEMARCHAPQFISSTPNCTALEYCTDKFTWRTNGHLMFKQNDSPGSLLAEALNIRDDPPHETWVRLKEKLMFALRATLRSVMKSCIAWCKWPEWDLKIAAALEGVWTCLKRWPWMWKGPNFNWVRFSDLNFLVTFHILPHRQTWI